MKNLISTNHRDQLNHLFIIGILWFVIVCVLSALYIQFFLFQTPCVLCLFQRFCFYGIGASVMLQMTNQPNVKYTSFGFIMIFIILLEIISIRHSLLNICPRLDHPWVNPAIFGIRMPIWSFLLSILMNLGLALNFVFLQANNQKSIRHHDKLYKIFRFSAVILLTILAINLLAIFFQCTFGHCHTYTYKFLNYF